MTIQSNACTCMNRLFKGVLLIHSYMYHCIGGSKCTKQAWIILDAISDKKKTFEEYTGESYKFIQGEFSCINFLLVR